MTRIPSTFVPLGEAVARATCAWFHDTIATAGVSPDEMVTLTRHLLASRKYADRPGVPRPRGYPRQKGIPTEWTKADEAALNVGPDIVALRNRATELERLPREAWERLRDLLSIGHLTGYVFGDDGTPYEVPANSWNHEDADTAHERGKMRFVSEFGHYIVGLAAVRRDDLDKALSRDGGGVSIVNGISDEARREPPAPARASGGRTRLYSREDFLIEAMRLLYIEGLQPKSRAELREAALQAYIDTLPKDSDHPSDEWAKPLIRSLWNRLELGEK